MKHKNSQLPYTCVLFESHVWHEEIFPQWVNWLNRLGFYVLIQTRKMVADRDATALVLGGEFEYQEWEPGTPPDTTGCDLLVVNTVSGYMHPSVKAYPLKKLAEISIPTISYIHEPLFWIEKFPLHNLDVHSSIGTYHYSLLRDGTYIWNYEAVSEDKWARQEEAFQLTIHEKRVHFQAKGSEWLAEEYGLWAEFEQDPMHLSHYLKSPAHSVFVCTRHSKALMNTLFPSVDFLLPLYFGEIPTCEQRRNFCISGEIDYTRKDFESLTNAAETIKSLQGDKVIILGGNRNIETVGKNAPEQRLKRVIAEKELTDHIEFTGYLSYKDFFLKLSESRFILPLVDRLRDGGMYLNKLTGSIALAISLGIPMVLDVEFAELYGLDFMPTYANRNLADGIEKAQEIGDQEYQDLCEQIKAYRDRESQENFKKLKAFMDQANLTHAPYSR